MKKLISFLALIGISLVSINTTFASFSDVPSTHSNYEAINYVQSEGIVEGYPGGTYQPEKLIDRYEFTKIIVGAVYTKEEIEACKTSPFKDVSIEWFTPYVCVAQKGGLVSGYPDGTFQGTNQIKLVEATKILVNGFKYPVASDAIWYKPYIMKLEELRALPTTLILFEERITRGEMAEMIYRLDAKITNKSYTTYENLEKQILASKKTTVYKNLNDYNQNFFALHQGVSTYHEEFLNSLGESTFIEDIQKVEEKLKLTINFFNSLKLKGLNTGDYNNDLTLVNALTESIDTKISVLNKEGLDLIELKKKRIEQGGDSFNEEIDGLMLILMKKIDDSNQLFYESQYAFCLKQKLMDDAYEYKEMAWNFYAYASSKYAFFLDKAKMTDSSDDLTALNERREQVINSIQGLKKIVLSLESYKNDNSVKDATIKLMDGAIGLLNNEGKEFIDLLMTIKQEGDESKENSEKKKYLLQMMEYGFNNLINTYSSVVNAFSTEYGI